MATLPFVKADKSGQPKRNNAARIFGYDVFISFALGAPPRGTHSYASDLARRLRELDFTVFFSEDQASPGDRLDSILLNALLRSRVLVVIANHSTLEQPRWVRKEVEAFKEHHPGRPIIPISVAGALQDAKLLEQTREWLPFEDTIWLDETPSAVTEGIASDTLVTRLALAPAGRSSNAKWLWVVRFVTALLIGLSVVAVGFAFYAAKQRQQAETNLVEAIQQKGIAETNFTEANRQKGIAETNLTEANRQKGIAETNLTEANRQKGIAETNLTEANRQKGIAEEQTANAKLQARIADARRLAAEAENLAPLDQVSAFQRALAGWQTYRTDETRIAVSRVFPELITTTKLPADISFVGYSLSPRSLVLTTKSKIHVFDKDRGALLSEIPGSIGAISPDGKMVVSADDTGGTVWNADNGKIIAPIVSTDTRRTASKITALSFSPDAARILVGREDGTATIHLAGTGRLQTAVRHERFVSTFTGNSWVPKILDAQFSPDGKQFATAADDESVRLWNASDGMLLYKLKVPNASSIQFSPDGRLIAILANGNRGNSTQIWSVITGNLVTTLFGAVGYGPAIFSPDSRRIVTFNRDSQTDSARVWNCDGTLAATLTGHTEEVNDASFSADGLWVLTASSDGTARVWNSRSSNMVATIQSDAGRQQPLDFHYGAVKPAGDGVLRAKFSMDCTQVLTVRKDGVIQIWSLAMGQNLMTLDPQGSTGTFSPDGSRVLTYGADKAVFIFDSHSGRKQLSLPNSAQVSAASWSPDNRQVVTIADEGTFWSAIDGHLIARFHQDRRVSFLRYSPDSKSVLILADDEALTLRSSVDGRVIAQFPQESAINDAVFSPNGANVVTAGRDGIVRVWTVAGKLLRSLKDARPDDSPDEAGIAKVSFSPEGRAIGAAGEWNTARVWDLASGRLLFRLNTGGRWVYDTIFSPDGTRILTDIKDDTYENVEIWTNTGERATSGNLVSGNTADGSRSAFSEDGRWFVTSGDGTIRVWNTDNGQLVANLAGVTAPEWADSAQFSPNGRFILTSGKGGVRLWRVTTLQDLDEILRP